MAIRGDFLYEEQESKKNDIRLVKGKGYGSYGLELDRFKEPNKINNDLDLEEQVQKYVWALRLFKAKYGEKNDGLVWNGIL